MTKKKSSASPSIEDVVRHEAFTNDKHDPSVPASKKCKGDTEKESVTDIIRKKGGEKHVLPTNPDYKMIDIDGGTADGAKS